jgi:hypothetical protein
MLPRALLVVTLVVASAHPAGACLPSMDTPEERLRDSAVAFQGRIVAVKRVGERDLGTVRVTKVLKGEVPELFVVSHPARRRTSCDHVGTLERQMREGTLLEFTLGSERRPLEAEPRVDFMQTMWPVPSTR